MSLIVDTSAGAYLLKDLNKVNYKEFLGLKKAGVVPTLRLRDAVKNQNSPVPQVNGPAYEYVTAQVQKAIKNPPWESWQPTELQRAIAHGFLQNSIDGQTPEANEILQRMYYASTRTFSSYKEWARRRQKAARKNAVESYELKYLKET